MPDTIAVENSEFANYCKSSADAILEYSNKFLSDQKLKINKTIKMCGSVIDCILETLNNDEYDYVVLGSHGKKGIQKWLGSVSQEIASVADVSTYVSKEKNFRQRILFAVDFSDMSPVIIKDTIDKFNLSDKEIYLTTVFETPDYLFLEGNVDSGWILDIEKKQMNSASLLLNKFETIFKNYGISGVKKAILQGNPSTELIKYLAKENIDLVVCGTRNHKKLPKFLLNSVSKRILESTKSDVLIVRQNSL
jgi:nucleotide-binding universal stress UspA family protein